ncbi:prepilin peptidase [Candidatus Sumerlaeota bacterium]
MFPVTEALTVPVLCTIFLTGSFIFGICWGSYFNVCIYRIPLGLSTSNPRRSYCFSCGSSLPASDNIPLLSYLLLGGHCRQCGSGFSSRYFWIEVLCGVLFALAAWQYAFTPALIAYWAFIGLMVVATFTDIDNWIIPDRISIGGFVGGVALTSILPFFDRTYVLYQNSLNSVSNVLAELLGGSRAIPLSTIEYLRQFHYWDPVVDALAGAGFGFGMLWLIRVFGEMLFRKEAMGYGDLKLFACIGAFLGWLNTVYVLMLACIVGSILGIGMLLRGRIIERAQRRAAAAAAIAAGDEAGAQQAEGDRQLHALPFGPYIALAAVLIMIFQKHVPAVLQAFSAGLDRLLLGE